MSVRTVQRWASGHVVVPAGAMADVEALARDRRDAIRAGCAARLAVLDALG